MLKNMIVKAMSILSFAVTMTACQEFGGLSIDTQGPNVEFQMPYEAAHAEQKGDYFLIAKSDSVFPIKIDEYLSEVGQTHHAVVEKADFKNAVLKGLGEGCSISDLRTIRIEVESLTNHERSILFEQQVSKGVIEFSECFMCSSEIFSLIESGYIAYLYVSSVKKPTEILEDGTVFDFESGTVIGIKVKGGALFDIDL